MSKRLKQAKRLVKEYAKIMNLQHWEIEVQESDNPDNYGSCWVNTHRNCAIIQINTTREDFEEEIVDTVIHELNHILHWDIDVLFYNATENVDSKQMEEFLETQYRQVMEKFIDANSRIITKLAKQKSN